MGKHTLKNGKNSIYKQWNIENQSQLMESHFDDKIVLFNLLNPSYEIYDRNNINKIINSNTNLHETIFGTFKQHFRYDIDVDRISDIIVNKYEIEDFVSKLIQLTIETINLCYGIDLKKSDFIIMNCHRPAKFSYHIIVKKIYFSNNTECKYLFNYIKNLIIKEYASYGKFIKYMDHAIYRRITNLRMYKSEKKGYKLKLGKQNTYVIQNESDTLIQNFENFPVVEDTLSEVYIKFEKNNPILYPSNDWCQKLLTEHFPDKLTSFTFIKYHNNFMYFIRTSKNTWCDICKRNHENENSLAIRIEQAPKKLIKNNLVVYKLYEYCRRDEFKTKLFLKEIQSKPLSDIKVPFVLMKLQDAIKHPIELKHNYIEKCVIKKYEEKYVRSYSETFKVNGKFITPETIYVNSQMGSGKTYQLSKLIDKLDKDYNEEHKYDESNNVKEEAKELAEETKQKPINQKSNLSVMMISFRISFNDHMAKELKLESYRKIKGKMKIEDLGPFVFVPLVGEFGF